MTNAAGVDSTATTEGRERFRFLPEHVLLEDTVATQDAEVPPDPTMGRDSDLEWLLRNAG